jgi:hypothetical protein
VGRLRKFLVPSLQAHGPRRECRSALLQATLGKEEGRRSHCPKNMTRSDYSMLPLVGAFCGILLFLVASGCSDSRDGNAPVGDHGSAVASTGLSPARDAPTILLFNGRGTSRNDVAALEAILTHASREWQLTGDGFIATKIAFWPHATGCPSRNRPFGDSAESEVRTGRERPLLPVVSASYGIA